MKLIESLLGLLTKQERPLHVGEVMTIWKVLLAFEDGHSMLMALANHTSDAELRRLLEHYNNDFGEPWTGRVKQFMQKHRIPLPPAGTDKTRANEADIPDGAKFTDIEIASVLAAKVVTGIGIVQNGLLECLNYELATLLVELEVAAYRQSFVIRETMERRGWLATPPRWHPGKASESN